MSKRHKLHFESKYQPMAPRPVFIWRFARNFLVASVLIGVSLFAGMLGYWHFEGMEWIDAFVNAAMILSGMGPLEPLKTSGGKLFAGLYALYSGLILVLASGIVLAPVLHRMFHQFHLAEESEK